MGSVGRHVRASDVPLIVAAYPNVPSPDTGLTTLSDMSELRVVAEIATTPGSEGIVRDALSTLVSATREEEGCLSYELFESVAAPGTFFTIESWRAQADLDAHMHTDHIAAAFATAGEHLSAPPAIHPLKPV